MTKERKETEVIIITGHGEIDTAIQALKASAFAYIQKPIAFDELEIEIQKALEKIEMHKKLEDYVRDLEVVHCQLKEQQAQILQAAKLSAVGQLGAGVAHEMNQPLMAIATNIEVILMNNTVASESELKEKVVKIKDQFARLGTIVRRLSDYSRGRIGEYEDVDINRPINDAYHLFGQQLADHNIQLELKLEESLPRPYLDRYQIQDVVINFLVNARDAVDEKYEEKEGGEITVVSGQMKNSTVVYVGILDNGSDIVKDTETELFNPFFTTKSVGKGTGLGLSLCHTIIKDHQGVISFATLADGSKLFYFALPLGKDMNLSDSREEIHKEIVEIFNGRVS